MTDAIVLRPTAMAVGPFDARSLSPDQLKGLPASQIAKLPFGGARSGACIGDLFAVAGHASDRIVVDGEIDWCYGVGARMSTGLLEIRGGVGRAAGEGMRGGRLVIHGNAGAGLGGVAPGESRGMCGGEIVVMGGAGDEAGSRMRRGLIVVAGSLGRLAGRDLIAGSIVALGPIGDEAGRGNRRGTIVAASSISVPLGYRYACTYRPPHLLLIMTYLRRRLGLRIADGVAGGRYRRYCGDAAGPAKGEILTWVES